MKNRILFLSFFAILSAFAASAQSLDSCRTQEQFQKELLEFCEKTQEYMRNKLVEKSKKYINETTDSLRYNQRQTWFYTKRIIDELGEQVALPVEINTIIGESDTTFHLFAKPDWDNAYFTTIEGNHTHLVVPLKAQHQSREIISELNVISGITSHSRYVTSTFTVSDGKDTEFIALNSNIHGELVSGTIYNKQTIINEFNSCNLLNDSRIVDYPFARYIKSPSRNSSPNVRRNNYIDNSNILERRDNTSSGYSIRGTYFNFYPKVPEKTVNSYPDDGPK